MDNVDLQPDPVGLTLFDVAIEESDGHWLSLNDRISYIVGGDSFGTVTQPQRRIMTSSPYVAGEYQVHSTPGNATETMTIYAIGETWQTCQNNIYRLIEALTQPKFLLRRDIEMNREIWSCWTAEYNVQAGRVFVANRMVPVQVTVTRLPQVTVMERSV